MASLKASSRLTDKVGKAGVPGSFFLGPSAENAELLSDLVDLVLNQHYAWRRGESRTIPTPGRPLNEVETRLFEQTNQLLKQLSGSMRVSGERYVAHELGDPSLAALIGWLAGMLHNQNNIVEEVSPVTSRLEKEVVKDLAKMLGFNSNVWGHLASGGTLATIEALWVARNKAYFPYAVEEFAQDEKIAIESPTQTGGRKTTLEALIKRSMNDQRRSSELYEGLEGVIKNRYSGDENECNLAMKRLWQDYGVTGSGTLPQSLPIGKVLVSEAAHYSVLKAVDILGIGRRNLVQVATDGNSRIDCDDLHRHAESSASSGVREEKVIAVVVSMGTTATGSVDPLDKILQIRKSIQVKYGISFIIHADAAYGGYANLVDWENKAIKNGLELRTRFSAIKRADSVTVDPHKLGYVPYPCGSVIFRDYRDKEFVKSEAPYLFHDSKAYEIQTLDQIKFLGRFTTEGSKPGSAATSAWLAHRVALLSTYGHGRILTRNVIMTRYLEKLIDKSEVLEKVNTSELNLLCIRIKGLEGKQLAKKTGLIHRELLDGHSDRGFVVSQEENDLFGPCLRVCIMNPFITKGILREFVKQIENLVTERRASESHSGGEM